MGDPAGWERCRSSVVEHSLGKGEAVSSILTGSTIFSNEINALWKLLVLAFAMGSHRGHTVR